MSLVGLATVGSGIIASYVTLSVKYERHEKEDNDRFNLIRSEIDKQRGYVSSIFEKINEVEKKQAASDEGMRHILSAIEEIKRHLFSIENLLRSRRAGDPQ